jgi:ABC-type multidrug transport system fused ATPase/permease subunit
MANVLDLISILLIGILGLVSMQAISGKKIENNLIFESFWFPKDMPFSLLLGFLGFIVLTTLVLKTLLNIYVTRRLFRFLSHKSEGLTRELFAQLFSQNYSKLRVYLKQDIHFLITEGTNAITFGTIAPAIGLFSDFVLVVLITTLLIIVSPYSTIVFLLFIGSSFFIIQKRIHRQSKESFQAANELRFSVKNQIETIVGSYRELYVAGYLNDAIEEATRARILHIGKLFRMELLPVMNRYLFEVILAGFGFLVAVIEFVRSDAISAVTTLGMFLIAAGRIAPSLLRLQQNSLRLQASEVPAKVFLDAFNAEQSLTLNPANREGISSNINEFIPIIEAKKLSFSFEDAVLPVFSDVTFSIDPGTINCICGESGTGKSTLIDLILGLLVPTNGSVTVSKLNPVEAINEFPGSISYVPQKSVFFNGTVRDYLTVGLNPLQTDIKHIEEMLTKVGVIEKIKLLPNYLDSDIEFNGGGLSGGEFQRLSIARALLSSPRILILDEATNALDEVSELSILSLIKSLRGETTVLLVSHNPNSIRIADNVIEINGTSAVLKKA